MDSNVIFIAGLVIMGGVALVAAAVTPVFFMSRAALKNKLVEDYGKPGGKS